MDQGSSRRLGKVDGRGRGIMNVRLELDCKEIARFEYGAHAMWAAMALSKEDDRLWTVIDERASEATVMEYRNGKAY